MEYPNFETKKEKLEWFVKNKELLIAQKKAETKYSDGFPHLPVHSFVKEGAIKANIPVSLDTDPLKVKSVINTTNIIDRHMDAHMPGLWKKSIQENKMIMHIQEHKMSFDSIISEGSDLKVMTKKMPWSELGFNFEGNTEALIFDSNVRKDRNSYMHGEYAKGHVKNHSVGMRYMQLVLAVNDPDFGAEFEAWEKYIDKVVNPEVAEDAGLFWVVKEAKLIEGSAVPIGSNWVTPTLENNMKSEPLEHSVEQPLCTAIDYRYLTEGIKSLNFVK